MPFDPNGALFQKERYHLMLIVQLEKRRHCYAHISSKDLATSTDEELDTWTKEVAPQPGHSPERTRVCGDRVGRALCLCRSVRYLDAQRALLSLDRKPQPVLQISGLDQDLEEHKGDTAYLFVSNDLVQWQYLHPFYKSRREWTDDDEDCMCPDSSPWATGRRSCVTFTLRGRTAGASSCSAAAGRRKPHRRQPGTWRPLIRGDKLFHRGRAGIAAQGSGRTIA